MASSKPIYCPHASDQVVLALATPDAWEQCPLYTPGQACMQPSGSCREGCMLVLGDAPSNYEAQKGVGFQGGPWQLLKEAMEAAAIPSGR